ncbi:MAG: hypothetical protein FWF75_00065 [Propionibacteriaceae bacterium]|nr:hypothetical protein [Propionibacteriaceae bacterium]
MSFFDLRPRSSTPAPSEPARPLPVLVGAICAVLIAVECLLVGGIFVRYAGEYAPRAVAEAKAPESEIAGLHTAIVTCGAVGVVAGVLLVICAIRMLGARRAWRNGAIVLLALNAIFPNAIAVVANVPVLALLVLVDVVGIVCLALPATAQWLANADFVKALGGQPVTSDRVSGWPD